MNLKLFKAPVELHGSLAKLYFEIKQSMYLKEKFNKNAIAEEMRGEGESLSGNNSMLKFFEIDSILLSL